MCSSSETIKKAVEGDLDMKIPERVKIVRIFTSSTFTGVCNFSLKLVGYKRAVFQVLRKGLSDIISHKPCKLRKFHSFKQSC